MEAYDESASSSSVVGTCASGSMVLCSVRPSARSSARTAARPTCSIWLRTCASEVVRSGQKRSKAVRSGHQKYSEALRSHQKHLEATHLLHVPHKRRVALAKRDGIVDAPAWDDKHVRVAHQRRIAAMVE